MPLKLTPQERYRLEEIRKWVLEQKVARMQAQASGFWPLMERLVSKLGLDINRAGDYIEHLDWLVSVLQREDTR